MDKKNSSFKEKTDIITVFKSELHVIILSSILAITYFCIFDHCIASRYVSARYTASQRELSHYKEIARKFVMATYQFDNPEEIDKNIKQLRKYFADDFYPIYTYEEGEGIYSLFPVHKTFSWGKVFIYDIVAEKQPPSNTKVIVTLSFTTGEGGDYSFTRPAFVAVTFNQKGKITDITEGF